MQDKMKHKDPTPSSPSAITLISPCATSFSLKSPNAQKERPAQICLHGLRPSPYQIQTSRMPSPHRSSSYARLWIHCYLDEVKNSASSSWIASEGFPRC